MDKGTPVIGVHLEDTLIYCTSSYALGGLEDTGGGFLWSTSTVL